MTRLSKKVLRGIEAEAMRLKNIYEAPNPEVDSIVESLRKEVELNKKRGIEMEIIV